MTDDMIILTRTFDLLAWLLPKSEKFPTIYRHTVTRRTMDAALNFQEALFDALSQGGTTRQKHLRTADAHWPITTCSGLDSQNPKNVKTRDVSRSQGTANNNRIILHEMVYYREMIL